MNDYDYPTVQEVLRHLADSARTHPSYQDMIDTFMLLDKDETRLAGALVMNVALDVAHALLSGIFQRDDCLIDPQTLAYQVAELNSNLFLPKGAAIQYRPVGELIAEAAKYNTDQEVQQ